MKIEQYNFLDINPDLKVDIRIDRARSVIYIDVNSITVLRCSPNRTKTGDELDYEWEIKYE